MKRLLLSSLFLLGGLSYSIAQVIAPWAEPFTGTSNPTSWTQSTTTGGPWTYTGNPDFGTNPAIVDHTNGVSNNYTWVDQSSTDAGVILQTPVIDATATPNPELKFWIMSHNNSGSVSTFNSIFVEASDGLGGWVAVATISGDYGFQWVEFTYAASTYTYGANLMQFRFRAESGGDANDYDNDMLLDDVSLTEIPTCPQPTAFVLDSADLTTASFSWTAGGTETEWAIEYGPMGFTPGTGTSTLVSPNPWYTIPGLTPQSFYDVYVRAACAPADTSFYTGEFTFNTYNQPAFMDYDNDCGPGFQDISATGTALNLTDDQSADIPAVPFPILYQGMPVTSITVSDNGAVLFNSPLVTIAWSNQTIAAATVNGVYGFWDDIDPGVGNTYYETVGNAPNRKFIVQFDEKQQYYSNNAAEIITFQIVLDEATGEMFTLFEDSEFGGSSAAYDNGASATQGIVGPNQDIQVSYNNATYLENNSCIRYYYTDCPKPLNYTITYVLEHEAAITWSSGLAGETNWTVIYGPAGFDPGLTGTVVQTGVPALIMPGLDDITTYDVYIYADCSPILQSLGATGSFTTLPDCANPTGLATSTAVDTVMSSWAFTENLGFPSTGFGIEYGWSGFASGTGTTSYLDNNMTDTTANITFMGGGVYDLYVQAICGTDTSSWVGPVQFIMPLTNDSTCFAEDLAVDGTLYTFNNSGATIDVGETAITPPATGCSTQTGWCNTNLNKSVWYTFIAPPSGNVRVNCVGINFDGQVAAYEATDCNDFATYILVGANDDGPNFYNPPLMNLCGLTAGMTYYLMYDSNSTTATGSYNIALSEIVVEAGTDNGLNNICLGDTVDLFNNIAGNDDGGVWFENIPTANFNDPFFISNGLASQVFGFDYVVTDGCAIDSIYTEVEIYAPSSAGVDGIINTCMNQPVDLLNALSGNVDLGGSWYDPANALMTTSAIAASAIPGQFNYDYITGNGVCPDDTANVVVIVDLNCDYLNLQAMYFDGMDLHPNPTTGMVYISNAGSTEVFNIELTDLNGKVITAKTGFVNGTETSEVNLGNLETGIYLIRVFNDNAEKTFRVVKQ